jgi:uncharacterized protein (TIRG00374 family)
MPSQRRFTPHLLLTVLRALIAIMLIGALAWFIHGHREELSGVATAMRHGDWLWLVGALVTQSLYYLLASFYFSRVMRIVGIGLSPRSIAPILLGAEALSTVAPSEFLAGQTLFLFAARQRHLSATRMVLGTLLSQLSDLFSFIAVLVCGLALLVAHNHLEASEIAASYFLIITVLCVAATVLLCLWHPKLPIRLLLIGQRLTNWLGRLFGLQFRLSDNQIASLSNEFAQAAEAVRHGKLKWTFAIFMAFGGHMLRLATLTCVVHAFGQALEPWRLLSAYALGTLVWVASPLPQGIGLVEGAYSLALASLGMPAAAAATVAIAYRGFGFWLPFLCGLVTLRQIGYGKHADSAADTIAVTA